MGSILQERVTPRCVERVSIRDREWKRKVSWSSSRANVSNNKMGRRQSQRKSPQPQNPDQNQENHHEKRQQRRKHKSNNPSTKSNTPPPRVQGPSASRPQCCGHKELKHGSMRGSKHTVVSSFSDSSSDLQERRSTEQDVLQEDSDTDLSETERLPVSHSSRIPPQLELRPEVVEADILSSHHHRPRQAQGGFDFPDFLPPPFNSWSLTQLAVFYNVEGRAAARPRPVGPLEKYLERLLQLEWHQIQTAQEESGKSAVSEVMSGCRSAAATTTSRLSSPKCILQCQRAFPLSFLSSLASHSTLLSGCACTPCQIRYSSCSSSCCRSIHSLSRPFRLSPMLERSSSSSRRPTLLPKRSYSESRVLSSERRCSSPGRTNSYLRRMQASGNMRNPIQGATSRPHSSVRDSGDHIGKADGMEGRMGAVRRRSGSEQRRGGAERQQNGSEKRRNGSECRKGRSERRRDFKEREIKPDAVTAIMDNLPGPKPAPIRRPNRTKQVEFVT